MQACYSQFCVKPAKFSLHRYAYAKVRNPHSQPVDNKSIDNPPRASQTQIAFFFVMVALPLTPSALAGSAPSILQFPTEATSTVRSLRNMTNQLLLDAAQVIPNQQLLINVVSKRVRQLGLGHRPMVETGPRASLTDIALKEIIAGKLTYESLEATADGA